MKKMFLFLSIVLMVSFGFSETVKTLPELSNPDGIYTSGNRLAVTEGTTIHLYSLPGLKHIETFGKKGEGPQEFKGSIDGIDMQTDLMVVSSRGKVSFFSKDGTFVKEQNAVTGYSSRFTPLGNGFVGNGFAFDKKIVYQTVNLYDSGLAKTMEIFRKESDVQRGKGIKVFTSAYDFQTCDNKVYIAGYGDFLIDVVDGDGKKLPSIKKEYKRLKFTDAHKEQFYDFIKSNPETKPRFEAIKKQLIFPAYFPAIRYIFAHKSMIYVQTYKMEGEKTEFHLFDLSGKPVKKVFLPIVNENIVETYPLSIRDGKVYQLVENEAEDWELRVIAIK